MDFLSKLLLCSNRCLSWYNAIIHEVICTFASLPFPETQRNNYSSTHILCFEKKTPQNNVLHQSFSLCAVLFFIPVGVWCQGPDGNICEWFSNFHLETEPDNAGVGLRKNAVKNSHRCFTRRETFFHKQWQIESRDSCKRGRWTNISQLKTVHINYKSVSLIWPQRLRVTSPLHHWIAFSIFHFRCKFEPSNWVLHRPSVREQTQCKSITHAAK